MTKEEEVLKQINKMLKENKLRWSYSYDFPLYRKYPDDVQLALNILEKHGMRILFHLKPEN